MPYIEEDPDVAVRLAHYAAQENCDGEPYDTMQAGADEIIELRQKVRDLENHLAFLGDE
jgi:hypothetical protein